MTIQLDRKCVASKFKNKASRRSKTINIILEENTLFEPNVYNEAKKTFLKSIHEVSNIKVDQVERTRKAFDEEIKHFLALETVSEYLHPKNAATITEMAIFIQEDQITISVIDR